MIAAFIQCCDHFFDMERLQGAKIFAEDSGGKQHSGFSGSTGRMMELVGGKALQDECATGLEPGNHFLVENGPEIGREVYKDQSYSIETCLRKNNLQGIRHEVIQGNLFFLRQPERFFLSGATGIKSRDFPAFAGSIDGISAFALGGHQQFSGGELIELILKKEIRLGAIGVFGFVVALVPEGFHVYFYLHKQ